MIKIFKTTELDNTLRRQLDAFVDAEFGHIPIVKETQWAAPDWTIISFINDHIAGFYNIVEREVLVDGQLVKTAGINNVITPPAFRGQGISTRMLESTTSFVFSELGCEMGLLLCADALVPFYSRLGWDKVEGAVYFRQGNETRLWAANAMIRVRSRRLRTTPELRTASELQTVTIDLNGLPW